MLVGRIHHRDKENTKVAQRRRRAQLRRCATRITRPSRHGIQLRAEGRINLPPGLSVLKSKRQASQVNVYWLLPTLIHVPICRHLCRTREAGSDVCLVRKGVSGASSLYDAHRRGARVRSGSLRSAIRRAGAARRTPILKRPMAKTHLIVAKSESPLIYGRQRWTVSLTSIRDCVP